MTRCAACPSGSVLSRYRPDLACTGLRVGDRQSACRSRSRDLSGCVGKSCIKRLMCPCATAAELLLTPGASAQHLREQLAARQV